MNKDIKHLQDKNSYYTTIRNHIKYDNARILRHIEHIKELEHKRRKSNHGCYKNHLNYKISKISNMTASIKSRILLFQRILEEHKELEAIKR